MEHFRFIRDCEFLRATAWPILKDGSLPPIGPNGRIMEWWKPFDEPWPGHRHKSHLYGLHPGRMITPEDTPQLARAVSRLRDPPALPETTAA